MEQGTSTTIDEKKIAKLPLIDPYNPSKKFTEKEEKWLREVMTYEFTNSEEPGLMNSFTYGNTKNKYTFKFFHGGKYRVPRFIANHVNSRGTPMWKWKPDGYGTMHKERIGTKSRFQMREVYEA